MQSVREGHGGRIANPSYKPSPAQPPRDEQQQRQCPDECGGDQPVSAPGRFRPRKSLWCFAHLALGHGNADASRRLDWPGREGVLASGALHEEPAASFRSVQPALTSGTTDLAHAVSKVAPGRRADDGQNTRAAEAEHHQAGEDDAQDAPPLGEPFAFGLHLASPDFG